MVSATQNVFLFFCFFLGLHPFSWVVSNSNWAFFCGPKAQDAHATQLSPAFTCLSARAVSLSLACFGNQHPLGHQHHTPPPPLAMSDSDEYGAIPTPSRSLPLLSTTPFFSSTRSSLRVTFSGPARLGRGGR